MTTANVIATSQSEHQFAVKGITNAVIGDTLLVLLMLATLIL